MAITQALTTSFKLELAQGIHNFASGGDTFRMALIRPNEDQTGNYGPSTTNYSELGADEVTGTGYTAGGLDLTSVTPVADGPIAVLDFADITFTSVTLTARGALIYNSSQSNRAVAVLDFGINRVANNRNFGIVFPIPTSADAIIRLR